MTEPLLRSLREVMLDETEPLAGLLRKCLLLGAETGSESLRTWARAELKGYPPEGDDVPAYRKLHGVPMVMDSMSGNTWAKGQNLARLQVPAKAREYVPEFISFVQPVEELAQLAQQKHLNFGHAGLAMAQTVWNSELGPYQSVVSLAFVVPGSFLSGILAQVRTNLVDMIADLTASTPLTELPGRASVDAAVREHVGDVYNTTVLQPSGPTAIGRESSANAGLSIADAVTLLKEVAKAANQLEQSQQADVQAAVRDLEAAMTTEGAESGEVLRRTGKLRSLTEKLGGTALTAATSSAVSAITELALQGAFG